MANIFGAVVAVFVQKKKGSGFKTSQVLLFFC
jgi:hypothetical protein